MCGVVVIIYRYRNHIITGTLFCVVVEYLYKVIRMGKDHDVIQAVKDRDPVTLNKILTKVGKQTKNSKYCYNVSVVYTLM